MKYKEWVEEYSGKLQISFIFVQKAYLIKTYKFPIQNHPFKCGLCIKNINSKVFSGGKIKNFRLFSIINPNLKLTLDKEFEITKLEPNEITKIWFNQPIITFIEGSVWIDCDIIPKQDKYIIKTFQTDKIGQTFSCPKPNNWGSTEFIQGEYEFEQARTNYLLIILTIITLLEGVLSLLK